MFCFICGLMGHNEKFCYKIFDTLLESIEKPYGMWMKAKPRRRNHTIGSKWLRQGNQFPVNNTVATEVEKRGQGTQGEIDGKDNHIPIISGIKQKTIGSNSKQINGGNI